MILLILFSSGESSIIKTIFIVIILASSGLIIGIIWASFFQYMNSEDLNGQQDINTKITDEVIHTGSTCEVSGLYQCVEHSHRRVNMKKGNRFPPCKGEEKGHSTDWILIKKAAKKT